MTSPRRVLPALIAFGLTLAAPALAGAATDPTRVSFDQPTQISQGPAFQAAEPSIRVDANDLTQRIWIAAPSGIGVNTRSLPAGPESGDLFWYSDDNGKTWVFKTGPGGVGSPTMLGGGDSDVATGSGPEVYGTGLTLADITLAASCDRGETFSFNPISVLNSPDDRQWLDTYEDRLPPPGAPQFVLTYGNFALSRIYFNQIFSPGCIPPLGGGNLDLSGLECVTGFEDDCYQWPGNVAVDEVYGDAYVVYNTRGNPDNDDIVSVRINHGASAPAGQTDVIKVIAANDRRDTFDSFVVAAVDRAGNVYAVWSERHPETLTTDTYLTVSRDRGLTWTSPVKVNSGPQTTTFPWIVAGDAGKIDIVYYGTSEKGPSPETVSAGAKWKVWMAQSLNALGPRPSFKEYPATGFMHQGPICTSGTGCAAGTRDLLDFFQIDVDAQGLANIAYTDNLNGPPDGSDPHQELIYFVQQNAGKTLFGK